MIPRCGHTHTHTDARTHIHTHEQTKTDTQTHMTDNTTVLCVHDKQMHYVRTDLYNFWFVTFTD